VSRRVRQPGVEKLARVGVDVLETPLGVDAGQFERRREVDLGTFRSVFQVDHTPYCGRSCNDF
jgi:hypothetical protein